MVEQTAKECLRPRLENLKLKHNVAIMYAIDSLITSLQIYVKRQYVKKRGFAGGVLTRAYQRQRRFS